MPLTEDELRAIEARAEAATPGEWRVRKGEGLWWTVEVELPSINGLRCWYTIARFDFDMAANGYTDGALRPEADATLLANARQDIPRLAAALREAWAALDAARREAEADLAGERGEYQRHSQGHMDRALAAEAAAAAMREALEKEKVLTSKAWECAENWENACIQAQAQVEAITKARALASPTPGAALLAERDRLREALERISALFPKRLSEVADRLHLLIAIEDTARAALKETSNG